MPGQKPLLHQLHMAAAPEYRRQMPLLMGKAVVGSAGCRSHTLSGSAARQKAGHIGTLHGSGAFAGADGLGSGRQRQAQLLRQFRKPHHVLKQRVRLPESQLAGFYRQKPPAVFAFLPVKPGNRGGIVAGVDAQCNHSLDRAKEPRMPLINDTLSSSSYRRAISTASLITAPVGASST